MDKKVTSSISSLTVLLIAGLVNFLLGIWQPRLPRGCPGRPHIAGQFFRKQEGRHSPAPLADGTHFHPCREGVHCKQTDAPLYAHLALGSVLLTQAAPVTYPMPTPKLSRPLTRPRQRSEHTPRGQYPARGIRSISFSRLPHMTPVYTIYQATMSKVG